VSAPLDAVLFDYGHTLIYFDERPHATLVDAYEKVNRLLGDTLKREVPAGRRSWRSRPSTTPHCAGWAWSWSLT